VNFHLGKQVWSGDEWCDRQAGCETVEQAWLRLFGGPLDRKQALAVEDQGDAVTYHMPNGHSVTFACDGNTICRTETAP
jgi:hypothetical protein